MKILEIRLKSKRNPNIFVASTDNGDFELHSDIIVKSGIKIGVINNNIFYNAVNESGEIIAFNMCVKYISSKVKTEKQIKDYLYKHEYKTGIIEPVIKKLKEYKIIDDKNYAESYIRSNSNFSKNKIKQKLITAGVKTDVMADELNEIDDSESCLKNAQKFLKNKQITKEMKEKLIRRLIYMGYTWETISSVLNKLKIQMEEDF